MSSARVHKIVAEQRGKRFEHVFARLPRIAWVPEEDDPKAGYLLWITPSPKRKSFPRKVAPGPAADAYEEWEGSEPTSEQDLSLPSSPLRATGKAIRIYYRFDRNDGDEWWHHDFDEEDRFFSGANKTGPRVFVVNGPDLQFTSRGIIN